MPQGIGADSYAAPVDFRITATALDQLPDNVRPVITTLYNAIQQVIQSLVNNCGIGPQPQQFWTELNGLTITLLSGNLNRFYCVAAEAIPLGAAIYIDATGAGGALQIHLASAVVASRAAMGFNCLAAIANGAVGEVILGVGVVSINGLTVGQRYALAKTAGLITASPSGPTPAINQFVGFAIKTNLLYFNVGTYTVF